MLTTIAELLDEAGLELVREGMATVRWKDGAATAGTTARQVKQNQQADLSSRSGVKLRDQLQAAIMTHPVFQAAVQPKHVSRLLVSKTEAGGGYGLHIDNPFMPNGDRMLRTDISFTLFLSGPDEYEGGELRIEQAGQTLSVKPQAGDMVVYFSTSLHQVTPVTAGTRLVCVGWAESQIQRADDRETVFDLLNLKAELSARYDPQSIELLTLSKTIANLKRRFS